MDFQGIFLCYDKHMKNKVFALSLLVPLLLLSGCDLIQDGNINDYVGTYKTSGSYHRVKHYYWGTSKLVSEYEPIPSGVTVVINSDKTVTYTLSNGEVTEGRIRVFKEYCKFTNLSFGNSWKFKIKDDGLYYSYTESKFGLEYDYVTEMCTLTKVKEKDSSN